MKKLATERLSLEPMNRHHAAEMFVVLADPAIYPFLDYGPPASVAYLHGLYTRFESGCSPDKTEIWWNFAVRLGSGQAAGYVQATIWPGRKACVGYVLASAHWGHGYACEAMSALLAHMAREHPVPAVMAVIEVENKRSAALLKCLGFRLCLAAELVDLAGASLAPSERLYVRAADADHN